jgi:hypothetical protein
MEDINETKHKLSKCCSFLQYWWVKSLIAFIIFLLIFWIGVEFGEKQNNHHNFGNSSLYGAQTPCPFAQKQKSMSRRGIKQYNIRDWQKTPNQDALNKKTLNKTVPDTESTSGSNNETNSQ